MRRGLLLIVAAALAALVLGWGVWRGHGGPGSGGDAPAADDRRAAAPAPVAPPTLRGDFRAGRASEARRPPALRGRVLGAPDRRPLAGAAVAAFGYEDLRPLETKTGPDGAFELPETAGRGGAFHLVVAAPGYGRFVEDSARPSAEARTIVLEPEGSIAGRLVEASDESAVRRFRVLALRRFEHYRDRQSAFNAIPEEQAAQGIAPVDDAQGRFRVDGLSAGKYALVFLVEGRAPFLWTGGGSDRSGGFAVVPGVATDAGTVSLPRSERVVVRVLDAETETPLAGAAFEGSLLVDDRVIRLPLRPVEMQAPGDYVLLLPFDARDQLIDADVEVRVAGYAAGDAGGSGFSPGTVFEVRLTAPARLEGKVRVDGADGAGCLVVLRRSVDRKVLASVVAGPAGAFSIADLPGAVDLEVLVFERDAARLRLTVPLRLRPGETRTITLGDAGATGVEGRITVEGKPVAEAWVFLDVDEQRIHCPTDEDGRFRFEAVSPGKRPLFANLEMHGGALGYYGRTVTVEEGRMTRVALDLSSAVRGRLTVRDVDGSPAAAGEKTVVARLASSTADAADWAPETRTAADGSFLLRLPGPGPWLVDLDEEDLVLSRGPVPVDLAQAPVAAKPLDLEATVDPQDGRIEIDVRDADTGEVVPDADYHYAWRHTRASGTTEGAVPVVVEKAGLGTYRFGVGGTAHVETSVEVEVTAKQRTVTATVSLRRSDAVRVESIEAGSQAETVGLRVGDLILRYGDRRILNFDDVRTALQPTKPTDSVRIEIVRDGAPETRTVRGGHLGVTLENARTSP